MIVGNLGQLAWLTPANSSDPHMYKRTYVQLHLGFNPECQGLVYTPTAVWLSILITA